MKRNRKLICWKKQKTRWTLTSRKERKKCHRETVFAFWWGLLTFLRDLFCRFCRRPTSPWTGFKLCAFLSLYGKLEFIKTKHENLSKAVDSTFLPCSGPHFSLFQHFSKVIPRHFMPRLPCAKIKQAQHEKERNPFKVELFFFAELCVQ